MRRTRGSLGMIVAVAMLLVSSVAAHAITFGEPDDGRHPATGALVFQDTDADGNPAKFVACSGGLIAPDLFVTAAHCTIGIHRWLGDDPKVYVSFEEHLGEPVRSDAVLYEAVSWHEHPGFTQPGGRPDVAVVRLAQPVDGLDPVDLPRPGLLDDLRRSGALRGESFTNAGYGVIREDARRGYDGLTFEGSRRTSVSSYQGLTRQMLHLSQNPSTGDGGTCYGDSGSPQYLGAGRTETRTIVSVTTTGDAPCRATNVVTRLDTREVLDWLGSYLGAR